ncbi:hypothetical protein [Microbacterium dauci]|uniref:Uncharacterized protein n=1 Tax=Microbacterium dauci TaxID=3048008 RepID=A0ABT6ZBP9_9MICO|nr:hypothetical protein [Microbacterium sp. LX3-4]MDJ1113584.1 hypothetical protein [Microbacterium sp. LX3-4]
MDADRHRSARQMTFIPARAVVAGAFAAWGTIMAVAIVLTVIGAIVAPDRAGWAAFAMLAVTVMSAVLVGLAAVIAWAVSPLLGALPSRGGRIGAWALFGMILGAVLPLVFLGGGGPVGTTGLAVLGGAATLAGGTVANRVRRRTTTR